MSNIVAIGSRVWANMIRPGYIVRAGEAAKMPVARVTEGYDTITFDDGNCHAVTVPYATLVDVLGYFNPDPPEELRPRQDWWKP